jgi:hypothetical protein
MSLIRYWPTRDEVNRCIKAEAESASDAVLLAVHQPMPLLRRDEGSGVESQVSEHELLEAFLTEDLPQGTLVMPITGPSGAGKSHLIRWLAAQLARDPRARHMHVIRIPKSASLRDVVELVLEPLSKDARFSEIRETLDKAIAQVGSFEAAVRFSGALEIALANLKARLLAELRTADPTADRRKLMARADHAGRLPGFINDAALRDHMTSHVLAPIIQRAVNGRDEPAPGEEELLPQFRADDLRIPDELRSALGQAAKPVQTYYQTGLNRADGAGREEAAKVLNEVVDEAIQQVFRLDQATGGVTLESIILRVRELLLEHGRELVLLIEDFAALSGIQQVLLHVCIQEAEYAGRQVRSRMRTALALTDGYLVGRDTIATRARQEWVIQPDIGADNVIGRTLELTGAYLNAARWGEKALKDRYEQSPRTNETDLTAWIETFKDEDMPPEVSEQLSAFGASQRGVPLFPYNRPAIAELAKRHLRAAGTIRFNPRRIINFILRDILLSGRDAFLKGDFPPAGFQDAKGSAALAGWLAAEPLSEVDRQRMEALMVYWGGNPSDPEQAAQIPARVFHAFGLESPKGLGKPTRKPKDQESPKSPEPTAGPPAIPGSPTPEMPGWLQRLDDWAGGTELGQRDAQKIRSVLLGYVERAIPWNYLRLSKRNLTLLLTIPNARGNDAPAAVRLAIAEDHNDPLGQLRQALLGALRLDASQGRWDYAEADEDSARVATLVERLVADLIPHLEQQRDQEVRVLSWILRRQARVLGLVPRTRMPLFDSEVRAIRNRADAEAQAVRQQPVEESRWQELRRDSIEMRLQLQEALLDRIGCRQGDGNTVYALDPTLLEFADSAEQLDARFLSSSQREHLAQLRPVRLAPAVRPLIEQLRRFSTRLNNFLGAELDKQRLISALNHLIQALEPIGVWPDGFTSAALKRDIESFRNDDLKKQLDEAGPLLNADADVDPAADSTLERLGLLNLSVIERADAFLSRAEAFIAAAERDLDVKQRELTGINPAADAETLARILDQIDRDICAITGEKSA